MTLVTPPPPEILIHVVGGGIGGKRWILNEMAPYFTTKPISLLAFFMREKKIAEETKKKPQHFTLASVAIFIAFLHFAIKLCVRSTRMC